MKIIITAHELIVCGAWDKFCDKHKINTWAVNEGQMDSEEEFTLTEKEANEYAFYITRQNPYK